LKKETTMIHKPLFASLFMFLGVASGAVACGGMDGERFSEQWGDDGDLSAQSALDEVDSDDVMVPLPRFPNCGILACPAGTECQFDGSGEARCSAPPWVTCSTLNCGPYHYCQMTPTGAICVSGSSDI
jgi:hypothetical protein